MSETSRSYLERVREELKRAICLQYFPSPLVERHSKPEVELGTTTEALLPCIRVAKGPNEEILLEPSINSVRISIKLKQADELERLLCHKFTGFMMQRAEHFSILRRKAIKGYDLSFLLTNEHTEEATPEKLCEFVVTFLEEIDRELNEMKIGVNSRARLVAETFLRSLA